jgi:hypothetical protein
MAKAKKAKTNGKAKASKRVAKPKTGVSFKTWATTLARGRGNKARIELTTLKADPANALKMGEAAIARHFPTLVANYEKFRLRGSQSKAAA